MPILKPIYFALPWLVLALSYQPQRAAQDERQHWFTRSIISDHHRERQRRPREGAAPSSPVQMHVEVYAAGGEKLFDQEIRGGNVFDWHLQDGQAQRLAPGAYVCVVTAKSVSGRLDPEDWAP